MKQLPSFFEEEFLAYVKSKAEERLFKYLDVNHEDNVVMVGIRPIISDLMDKVIVVPPEVLNEKDWWHKGFPTETTYCSIFGKQMERISSNCRDHVDLVAYANELCRDIYRKHKEQK